MLRSSSTRAMVWGTGGAILDTGGWWAEIVARAARGKDGFVAEASPAPTPPPPVPEFVAALDIAVGPPLVVGPGPAGERRVVPILGGTVAGPRLSGEVLPGGADYQLVRPDGVAEIEARYALRLAGGALVYVVNRGLRRAADPEALARLLRGEPVPSERVYFRTAPAFETADPAHAWLRGTLFLGVGERLPDRVRLRLYAV